MAGLIRDLKKFDEFSWLKAFDSAASQQVARDLETALKNSFTKGRAQQFPTFKISFKLKKRHDDSFRCVNNSNCIRIENGAISIPKVGKVPIILHRKLSSKIKTATVQLTHGKISRQRLAFAHEVSCSIAKSSDIIVFEDLNVKGMQQFNGQMVNDNVMGMITVLTQYKADLNGSVYHEIGRYVKSSGICYECKHEHKFDLGVREFACKSCGLVQCRDLAAAKSVADTGEKDLMASGILARALPKFQQKSPSKTKVFEQSEFGVGTEKKEAA
jgi:transposase